jgi:cytidylate kinase
MAIITISREYGSGGDELADRLCEVLGYRAFGKAQIIQAVEETTYPRYMAIDYSEDQHEVRNFLDRLLGQTASPAQKIAWSEDPSIATRPERAVVDEGAVLGLVRRAISAAGEAGNMVIVGRGGQVLLMGKPGVFHVRIEAPIEQRIQRVKAQIMTEPGATHDESELLRSAADLIANRDISSADYIKRFYNVDWNDTKLYHLVLNLGKLSIEQAVEIIVALIQTVEARSPAA